MFVEKATSQGNKNIHNILHNGRELATNIMLAAEVNYIHHNNSILHQKYP